MIQNRLIDIHPVHINKWESNRFFIGNKEFKYFINLDEANDEYILSKLYEKKLVIISRSNNLTKLTVDAEYDMFDLLIKIYSRENCKCILAKTTIALIKDIDIILGTKTDDEQPEIYDYIKLRGRCTALLRKYLDIEYNSNNKYLRKLYLYFKKDKIANSICNDISRDIFLFTKNELDHITKDNYEVRTNNALKLVTNHIDLTNASKFLHK